MDSFQGLKHTKYVQKLTRMLLKIERKNKFIIGMSRKISIENSK